jgi:type IV pilus assembly protein PilV
VHVIARRLTGRSGAVGRADGFGIVEVMAALIVISVGLLGLAKMQALAISSTTVASARSLAALEAASHASAMHANRGYWATSSPKAVSPISVTATAGTADVTISASTLSAAQDCTTAGGATACSPEQLAAADLQEWGRSLQALLPGYTATVDCDASTPVSCAITIDWTENTVALTKQETSGAALQAPKYTLYVQP